MRVIGIDQSYTGFGFCVDGESKKKSFPADRYDNDVHRLIEMRSWFMQWLALQKRAEADLVVMEGYANNAKYGREMSGELGGMIKMAVWDVYKGTPLVVPPNSLKKFVLNKVGKKNEMLLGVYKQWGVSFSDDNQADAFALEKFGYAYLYLRDEPKYAEESGRWHQYQIKAVQEVMKGK